MSVYRLTMTQKTSIAQNLIDICECNAPIEKPTATFVGNWILTGPEEKFKAYYDVWDLVLKNYLPKSRPILFRSCSRRTHGKIASFTGRLESAQRFSGEKGFLLICQTEESLKYEETFYKRGEYRHTFYPLSEVIKKDNESKNHVFSDRLRKNYAGEDEYIMRVDSGYLVTVKWCKS
jgi:hypothetical protein